jgi:hypothetical protein
MGATEVSGAIPTPAHTLWRDPISDRYFLIPDRADLLEEARGAGAAGDTRLRDELEQKVRRESEELAEEAGKTYAREHLPGFEPELVGRGPGTFDQVYVNRSTGEVVILETKGGASGLGTRFDAGGRLRVQQGTGEYVDAIVVEMRKKGGSAAAAADEIEAAIAAGQLRYIEVRQPFTKTGDLASIETREFAL